MAPWSSLTSPHSQGLLALWSSLLLPLLFLLLLAPQTSRPQGIENFKCWNLHTDSDATNQSHGKRGTTTTYKDSPKACDNQTCFATIVYPYNLKNNLKGDIKNKIGIQHEVYCRFNSSIFNADDIYLEAKNRSRPQYRLPHKIINDSTIMAMLPSDYPFNGNIQCRTEEQVQFLCFREVKIGYEPQDVENFTCISDNWETLNCTWDVPDNPLKVDYTLTYVVPRFMNRTNCPQDNNRKYSKKRNWCFWAMTTQPQFVTERQHMIFTIHGKNDLGNHSFSHDIDIYEVVRPKPPSEFKTNVTGPYSVTIEWNLPYPMKIFPGNVRYEISTRLSSSENDNDHHDDNNWTVLAKELIILDTHDTNPPPISVPLRLKYANTDYEIRMRFHTGTGTIREHMWSIPMIKAIRTLSTKPTVAPKTIQGMFEVHNSLDKRDIFIFWQKIDPLLKNGDGFKYIVDAYDESDKKVPEQHEESSFVKFENLKFNSSYRFVITSSNENGTADNHSMVHVPRKTAVQNNSKTFNVIARESKPEGRVHTVSWSFEEGEQVQSITIFWCKKSGYDYRCKNKMEWLTINWSDMATKEKNFTLESGTQYAFGRAVTSNNESSGIVWIRCVASSGNEPPKVDRLAVNELSATSVTLNWEMGCGDKAAIPTGVNISYCEIPKSDIEQQNQEDACKDDNKTYKHIVTKGLVAKIEDLHPFTKYRFSIAVLTEVGQGKWSDAEIVDTETAAPSGPPVDFNIHERGSTWVMFKWKPPLESLQNGKITKFQLITDPCDVTTQNILIAQNRLSPFEEYNITGLQSYTNYKFELAACTLKGCSRNKTFEHGFTKTGVPGNVRDIYLDPSTGEVKFELDDENAWKKMFELRYTINDTEVKTLEPSENEVLQIPDWQETCVEDTKVVVEVRVINIGEDGQNNTGSWKESNPTTCQLTGDFLLWWQVVLIILAVICGMAALGWIGWQLYRQAKTFCEHYRKDITDKIPLPNSDKPVRESFQNGYNHYQKVPSQPTPINKDYSIDRFSDELNQTDLDNNRSGRNPSGGESVNSEAETINSSGCSTGPESDSFSENNRVTPESEAANGQEEWNLGLRHRTPQAPPYVQIMPDKFQGVPPYVSVGSVPNLRWNMNGTLSLPQSSTPNLAQEQMLTQLDMTAPRRTSTGYISMPDADAPDSPSNNLDLFGSISVRPGDRALEYSRHNYNKIGGLPDFLAYTKSGSLPRLNTTGYVTVAQVPHQIQNQVQSPAVMVQMPSRGDSRDSAQPRAYVQLGEDIDAMKRPPSLPFIPNAMSKSYPTPDEERPMGAYCKIGSRGMSPGPVSAGSGGYVTTDAMASIPPRWSPMSQDINKSPYVTAGQASSITSPSRGEPMNTSNAYVSVSDGEAWAQRCPPPPTEEAEDNRKSQSAPMERSPCAPATPMSRPNTSEGTIGREPGNHFPSLSIASSGYGTQEILCLSPKTLVAQNHEPQSAIYTRKHNVSSMV